MKTNKKTLLNKKLVSRKLGTVIKPLLLSIVMILLFNSFAMGYIIRKVEILSVSPSSQIVCGEIATVNVKISYGKQLGENSDMGGYVYIYDNVNWGWDNLLSSGVFIITTADPPNGDILTSVTIGCNSSCRLCGTVSCSNHGNPYDLYAKVLDVESALKRVECVLFKGGFYWIPLSTVTPGNTVKIKGVLALSTPTVISFNILTKYNNSIFSLSNASFDSAFIPLLYARFVDTSIPGRVRFVGSFFSPQSIPEGTQMGTINLTAHNNAPFGISLIEVDSTTRFLNTSGNPVNIGLGSQFISIIPNDTTRPVINPTKLIRTDTSIIGIPGAITDNYGYISQYLEAALYLDDSSNIGYAVVNNDGSFVITNHYISGLPLILVARDGVGNESEYNSTSPNIIYIPSQYSNLTSAFNAINNGTHGNGNLTVRIDGSFTQTSSATLNGGAFTSLKIVPTTNATISGNVFDPMILLNGADNVTIDGRIGGTDAANNLTFTNSSSPATNIKMQNGATNNVVRYCNLNLPEYGQNVYIAQSTPGTGGNNDNTIEYCVLSGGLYSLHTTGTAGASGYINARTTFRNNTVKNFRQLGIVLGLETLGNNVTQNEIFNDAAISPYLGTVFCIYNFGVGTSSITKNYIHDMAYGGSNAIQIYGVYSSPSLPTVPGTPTTSTVNVINNIVALGGNNPFTYHGIISSSSGMLYTANLYYNSVRIFGNSNATINQTSSGISQFAMTTGSTYNQYNNLVRNDRTGGGPATIHYGTSRDPFSGTINADYNTIRATDPLKGVNARFSQNYSSIKKYKDAIAKHNVNNNNFNLDNSELHSSFQPAPFMSNTNLHLNAFGVGGDMNAKSFALIAADDIDNQVRSSTFPYRGADDISFMNPLKLLNLTFALEAITNPPSSNGDIIILQLINPSTCAIVAFSTATLPPAPGNTAIFAFGNLITNGTPYYLRIIHRNSLSLWSATTQSFASGSLTYDFTNSLGKAFGGNAMKFVGTEWSMVSGDVNWDVAGLTQDGFIDGSDLLLIDNDAFNSVLGYVDTDLTGDNYVDGSDLALGDNNRSLFEQAPCALTNPEHVDLKDEVKSKKINSINRPTDEIRNNYQTQ